MVPIKRDKKYLSTMMHMPFSCQDGATIRGVPIRDDQWEADMFTGSLWEHNTREQMQVRWGHFVDRLQPIVHDQPLLHSCCLQLLTRETQITVGSVALMTAWEKVIRNSYSYKNRVRKRSQVTLGALSLPHFAQIFLFHCLMYNTLWPGSYFYTHMRT